MLWPIIVLAQEPRVVQRMRFVLDFGFGTGLRASELVGVMLGNIEIDAGGDAWLHVVGKGSKVVLPLNADGDRIP